MPILREFMVRRDDLAQIAVRDRQTPPCAPGQLLLEIEAFALTANNITYAVVGEQLGYWNFFPAPTGWGIVPVWGHARVIDSAHPEIARGERLYGYLPMASHVLVEPGKIGPGLFRDMAAHRQPMSPVYNQYRRLAADPAHDPLREDARMLFEPLFLTSFLIEDVLRRADWHGARAMILTSASSKTALGLAHVARARSPGIARIGLTSAAKAAFVTGTGLYDRVVRYDDLAALADTGPAVAIDFAGNADLLARLHATLGAALRHSLRVGVTHHEARTGDLALVGPKPVWFFAPDAAVALIGTLGQDGFQSAVAAAWRDFVIAAEAMVTVHHGTGPAALEHAWRMLLGNQAPADTGTIVTLNPVA